MNDPKAMRRRFGWRNWAVLVLAAPFFAVAAIAFLAVFEMAGRGETGEDAMFAGVLGGMMAVIGGLLSYAAFARRDYVDDDGTIVPYIVMAQLIASDSFDDHVDGADS